MADFKASLKKGLTAAEKAQDNRQEILSVLADLNAQLSEETEGTLEVIQEEDYKDQNALVRMAAFSISGLGGASKMEMLNYLSCRNPRSSLNSTLKLSEFKLGRAGYPCELKFGGEEIFCEDRQALEVALSYLLSDPVAAEKMYKVMQFEVFD